MRGGDGGEAVVVSFRFFWTDGLLARRAGIGGWWCGLSLFFLFGFFFNSSGFVITAPFYQIFN
jgi:hypothetical protein